MNDTYLISPFKRIRFVSKQTNKQINLCCVIFTFLNRERKVVLSHCFRLIIASFSFHFRSSYMIYFIYHLHSFFHGNIWTHNWPAPNVSAFIAQLVEHHTGIARSRIQTPLKSWIFFRPSLRNCINCVHCDDHFFIFISFPQFIYDLFHISFTYHSYWHKYWQLK